MAIKFDEIYTEPQVAKEFNTSTRTMRRRRQAGTGPEYFFVDDKSPRYSGASLMRYAKMIPKNACSMCAFFRPFHATQDRRQGECMNAQPIDERPAVVASDDCCDSYAPAIFNEKAA